MSNLFTDYHVHTAYSDDSVYPMEDVVRDAVRLGINELCFTDHVDYGIKRDWDDPLGIEYRKGGPQDPEFVPFANVNYPEYYREISSLREKYAGQITIRLGLEFGIQTHTIEQYENLFARYPFDFIIFSVHQVDDKEFWPQDFQKGKSQAEYNMRYYQEIYDVMQRYHNYSILGHLDLITRYDKAGRYPFSKIKPIVTKILEAAIADGKGIEVNTSSHRYGLDDLTPSRDILRLYRELGGEILTIGSDSHKPEHLGKYIQETKAELKSMGFHTFCTYERMQPIYHEL